MSSLCNTLFLLSAFSAGLLSHLLVFQLSCISSNCASLLLIIIYSLSLSQATNTTLRYHMGTAGFGSLIIAIVKTIRAVIAYMQKQAKASKNKILEYLMCVLQCCMWCLEIFLKIKKNALRADLQKLKP